MAWITTIVLILGGALAASSFILAKKPNAKDLFVKIAPYQGTIGVGMFAWGVWDTIHIVTNLTAWKWFFSIPHIVHKLFAVVVLVAVVCELVVGFLLGFNLIQAQISKKSPEAARKAEVVMKKLAPWQTIFGFAAIFCGIYFLLYTMFLFKMGLGI